ncbi:MAG: type IV pilin protein, partial [Rhizobacter sp.]
FTMIELLVVLAIAALVATLAYPSFNAQVLTARRSDALVAVMAAQMAQERWRADRPGYGSQAELGLAVITGAGHYAVQVVADGAAGYQVHATARGPQDRDSDCRHLRLSVKDANMVYESGADARVANPAALNRRCWRQ